MKYRVFYDGTYRNDTLDYSKDISARTNKEALAKALKLIDKLNLDRAITRQLTGISRVTSRKVKKVVEKLIPITF